MNKKQTTGRRDQRSRRKGAASVEVVMSTGIMLPVAGALFFLAVKMCAYIYSGIAGLVCWPFL